VSEYSTITSNMLDDVITATIDIFFNLHVEINHIEFEYKFLIKPMRM